MLRCRRLARRACAPVAWAPRTRRSAGGGGESGSRAEKIGFLISSQEIWRKARPLPSVVWRAVSRACRAGSRCSGRLWVRGRVCLPTSLVQCFVPFKCGFLASFPYEASQLVRSVTQADFRRSWDAGSVRHLSHSKHRVAGPRAENGDSRLFRRRARHTRALGAQTIPPGLRPRTRRTVTLQAASPARRQRGDSAVTVQQCRRGGRIPPQHPPAPG
jgi:hypothetical protein